MGLLSEEQYAEMVDKIDESKAAPPEEPTSDDSQDEKQEEVSESSPVEDVKEEAEAQVEDQGDAVPKTPQSIPYSRFKQVNDRYRDTTGELERSQERIRELEQLIVQKQPEAQPESSEWLDEVFGKDEPPAWAQEFRNEVEALKAWQNERTEQLVTVELEQEISDAVKNRPDVSANELWEAVAIDGTVDVDLDAQAIQEKRESMKTQWTGEYQSRIEQLEKELEQARQGQSASGFRRPSGTSSGAAPTEKKPRTMQEAANMFAQALRDRA